MGAGLGRQGSFRTIHTARNPTSPFPRKQSFPTDRPGAVQGAKRQSGPLTARTGPGSSRERKRGHPNRSAAALPICPVSEPSRRDKYRR